MKRCWRKLLTFIVVVFLAAVMLSPVYILVKVSIGVPGEVLTQHPPLLIHHATLKHWWGLFASGELFDPMFKSLRVATWTMFLGLALTAPAAYVISRLKRKWKYLLLMGLFFPRMFPEVGIALPISVTFIKMDLLDTDLALVLAHLIKTLPFVAWILVGTFSVIPTEVEEASEVDGCSKMQSLIRVILPLSLSGVAVAAVFLWLESWNEFTYALYLTLVERTIPLQAYYYVVRGNWFNSASYSIMLMLPVVIVTFVLQRYIKGEYLSGALKG